ncbi:MAG: 4Fe-4S binding protein [Oscillospiraceae bacterium]
MKKRFKVTFNRDKCKGCEICVSFCPKKILAMDPAEVNAKGYHPATILDQGACIGCQSCALMCPDCCIRIYELEEGEEA